MGFFFIKNNDYIRFGGCAENVAAGSTVAIPSITGTTAGFYNNLLFVICKNSSGRPALYYLGFHHGVGEDSLEKVILYDHNNAFTFDYSKYATVSSKYTEYYSVNMDCYVTWYWISGTCGVVG